MFYRKIGLRLGFSWPQINYQITGSISSLWLWHNKCHIFFIFVWTYLSFQRYQLFNFFFASLCIKLWFNLERNNKNCCIIDFAFALLSSKFVTCSLQIFKQLSLDVFYPMTYTYFSPGQKQIQTQFLKHLVSKDIFLPETTTWHNSSENSFLFSISLLWCLSTVSRRLLGSLPPLTNILIMSSCLLSIVSLMSVSEASIVRIKWRHWCWNNERINED